MRKDVNKLLKLDHGNAELMAQKLLTQAISEFTTEKQKFTENFSRKIFTT